MTTTVKNNITEPSTAHIEEGESFELKASSTHPDQKKSKHRHSSLGHHESHEWKAAERRVVRKLDMTLLPVVWVLYMFNYLDRNNIAQARLDNFEEDLGLHGTQFNVAVSILNVGYMLAQLPSNMILTRVRPSLYLPSCVIVWSAISAATAGVRNYSGLIAVRFFLGIVEAPFFPGCFTQV
ncbi:High-affinity nicotinic acid transporter [Colletotrichum sp. SAR 10_75]|nr:High-affinity nicotinic acid transporter [Colletotrichum sp. SAR 10_75]